MKKNSFVCFLKGSSVALLIVLCGCSNHLETFKKESLDYDRSPKPQITYRVKSQVTPQAPLLVQFDITEQKRTRVDTYSVSQTIERSTPYSGWRELYEVPTGICLLPVSICCHIFNVVTFGVFPYNWAASVTALSFSGMNPAINFESSTRYVDNVISNQRKKIDSKEEFVATPAANVPVELKNATGSIATVSQNNGVAQINLVNTAGYGPTISGNREIHIFVAGSATPCDSLIIDRKTQRLIYLVSEKIKAYHKAPSGIALNAVVNELEQLNASKLAFQLEKEEISRNQKNKKFMSEFYKAERKEK